MMAKRQTECAPNELRRSLRIATTQKEIVLSEYLSPKPSNRSLQVNGKQDDNFGTGVVSETNENMELGLFNNEITTDLAQTVTLSIELQHSLDTLRQVAAVVANNDPVQSSSIPLLMKQVEEMFVRYNTAKKEEAINKLE